MGGASAKDRASRRVYRPRQLWALAILMLLAHAAITLHWNARCYFNVVDRLNAGPCRGHLRRWQAVPRSTSSPA